MVNCARTTSHNPSAAVHSQDLHIWGFRVLVVPDRFREEAAGKSKGKPATPGLPQRCPSGIKRRTPWGLFSAREQGSGAGRGSGKGVGCGDSLRVGKGRLKVPAGGSRGSGPARSQAVCAPGHQPSTPQKTITTCHACPAAPRPPDKKAKLVPGRSSSQARQQGRRLR